METLQPQPVAGQLSDEALDLGKPPGAKPLDLRRNGAAAEPGPAMA